MFFCKGCRNGEGRCNGRGKQGKDALSVCAQGLCKDAKPTKHTQTLTLRKARGIVRFWKGWCRARDSSEAIPPVVARIFSGDSTSPLTREASVMAIFEGLLSFCNCCENGSIRCNGRSKQGKDALACVPKGFARMQSQPSTHRHSSYEKRVG